MSRVFTKDAPCQHPDPTVDPVTWCGAIGKHEWCSLCGALREKGDTDKEWGAWNLPKGTR